jgi:hypothetical protein
MCTDAVTLDTPTERTTETVLDAPLIEAYATVTGAI